MESRKTERGDRIVGRGGGGGRIAEKIPMLKARTRYQTFFLDRILNGVLTSHRFTRDQTLLSSPLLFFPLSLFASPRDFIYRPRYRVASRRRRRRRGKFAAARSSKRIAATKIKRARHAAACRSNDTFVLFPPRILRRPSGATGVKGPGTVERLDSPLRRGCLSRANRAEPPQPLITTLSSLSLSSSRPPIDTPSFSNCVFLPIRRQREFEKLEVK